MPTDYMSTRCPAWCDRILMSPQVNEIIQSDDWTYGMIGEAVCMGDHKVKLICSPFQLSHFSNYRSNRK